MREHRSRTAAARARFAPVRASVRPVRQVLRAAIAPRVTRFDRHTQHLHLTVAPALSLHAAAPRPVVVAPTRPMATYTSVLRPMVPRAEAPMPSTRVLPTMTAAADQALAVLRPSRSEDRVATVPRVVAHSTTANSAAAAVAAPSAAPDSMPAAWSASAATPAIPSSWPPASGNSTPVAASTATTAPIDITSITNQVMTAIDRRLIAHAERLGRG